MPTAHARIRVTKNHRHWGRGAQRCPGKTGRRNLLWQLDINSSIHKFSRVRGAVGDVDRHEHHGRTHADSIRLGAGNTTQPGDREQLLDDYEILDIGDAVEVEILVGIGI